MEVEATVIEPAGVFEVVTVLITLWRGVNTGSLEVPNGF
jgi:hypothetical protein